MLSVPHSSLSLLNNLLSQCRNNDPWLSDWYEDGDLCGFGDWVV